MEANTTGSENTAIGTQALQTNVTDSANTAVGYRALESSNGGNYNTAVGSRCLEDTTTGDNNTAVGYNALHENTTGADNVAVGHEAAFTGSNNNNTSAGYHAFKWSTGADNVSVGKEALRGNGSGSGGTGGRNVAIGYQAMLSANGNAYRNTAVGWQSMKDVTTGYQNVCLGKSAGYNLTTGARNVILGPEMEASAVDRNYEYSIGYATAGNGDGTFYVHSTSGAYNGTNSSTWHTTSDIRIKKNVTDNNTGLDILKQIQVRNFEYKTKEEIVEGAPELKDVIKSVFVEQEGTQLGVIAQEIEKVLPEVVDVQSTGIKTVTPDNLTWHLVNAVKELSAKNDALAAEVEQLKSQLNN